MNAHDILASYVPRGDWEGPIGSDDDYNAWCAARLDDAEQAIHDALKALSEVAS